MSTTVRPRSRRAVRSLFAIAVMALLPVFAVVGTAGAHTGTNAATPGNDSSHPWKSNGCGPSGKDTGNIEYVLIGACCTRSVRSPRIAYHSERFISTP